MAPRKKPDDEEDLVGDPLRGPGKGQGGGQFRQFIERIERLEQEKKVIGEDIKEIYTEAKSFGFDTKIMRKVIMIRRVDTDKRREETEILDLYLQALGMLDDD